MGPFSFRAVATALAIPLAPVSRVWPSDATDPEADTALDAPAGIMGVSGRTQRVSHDDTICRGWDGDLQRPLNHIGDDKYLF